MDMAVWLKKHLGAQMNLKKISIKTKVLAISLAGPVIVAIIFSWFRVNDIQDSAIKNIEDKSKAIVLMAEATRNEMARKLDLGVIKPFTDIDPANVVEAVPVVTAIQAAAINAEKAGYKFRAPKVSPRNKINTPTEDELKVLKQLKSENLTDLTIVTKNELRYFKPIKLTKECLFCHGDPKGEKDPTGGTKEGWKEGEIHGAFEIISSLKEVNANILKAKTSILIWTLGILAVIGLTAWFLLQRNVIHPLRAAGKYINAISKGDLTKHCEVSSEDEFGSISTSLEKMAENLRDMIKNVSESSITLQTSSDELDHDAAGSAKGAKEMSERSISVAAAAEEMSANMNTVAAATEEASTNIALVAEATKDMSSTLNEISVNTEKTQTIALAAVSQAESASVSVDELGSAAQKIGKVTETITEISEQTNLLALNATIEAARAGEAGKGFAVVANEIKELARQTAAATMEIKSQIEGIQHTTSNTVVEIQNITKVINEVNDIVVTVVAAVEEQNITTNEIAENISQATLGIQEVTENVSQSSIVADEVATDINQVSSESTAIASRSDGLTQKADELKTLSVGLKEMMEKFKV